MADFIPDSKFVPDQVKAGSDFIPDHQFSSDEDNYGDVPGQVATGALGALNSMTAGLGSAGLDKAGIMSADEQRVMRETNPISYGVGNVAGLLGGPVAEGIGAAGAGAKALVGSGILGSAAKLATEAALFQTTDEVAKKMMADPNQTMQTAAIDIGLSGLLGGAFGTVGGIVGKGLEKASDSKIGEFLSDFKNRIAEHVAPETVTTQIPNTTKPFTPGSSPESLKSIFTESKMPRPEIQYESLSPGQKAADSFMESKLTGQGVAGMTGGAFGHATGIPFAGTIVGGLAAKTMGPALDSVIKPLIRGVVSGEGFEAASRLAGAVIKGENALQNGARAVFDKSMDVIPSKLLPTKEHREAIRNVLKTSQDAPQSLMKAGGQLDPYMPAHNTALGQLVGNSTALLGTAQPRPSGGSLPLDTKRPPTKGQEAMFNRSLDIAQQPLMVLQHIKDGTLMSHDLQTFAQIYPNLHPKIANSLISSMIEHVAGGGHVPYRTRMGLSLFTGAPLDSTMTPQALQSLQTMYAAKQNPPQQNGGKRGSTKSLDKVSSQYQTAEQSREARKNK